MNLTGFFNWLGDAFTALFKFLATFGAGFNYLIMAIIAGLLVYWTLVLVKEQAGKSTEGLYPFLKDNKKKA